MTETDARREIALLRLVAQAASVSSRLARIRGRGAGPGHARVWKSCQVIWTA